MFMDDLRFYASCVQVWVGINDDWKDFRKVISLQAMKSF